MEERKKTLVRLLGEGKTLTAACREVGITRATYYNWRRRDPDFAWECDLVISSNHAARSEAAPSGGGRKRENRAERAEEHTTQSGLIPYTGPSASETAAAHAEVLREAMKARKLYSKALEPQIEAAARQWASAQLTWADIDRYSALQPTVSREGDLRLTVNPIFTAFRAQLEGYTSMLRALGLNFCIKAEPDETGSRASFFAALADEGDEI